MPPRVLGLSLSLVLLGCGVVLGLPDRVPDPQVSSDGSTPEGDAGSPVCPPREAGVLLCTETELQANTRTLESDAREITLPKSSSRGPYEPNCMVIRAGQTVTWTGKISDHPLQPRNGSTAGNPIPEITRDVGTVPVLFPCAGDFNFGCKKHGDAMSGTIRVLP